MYARGFATPAAWWSATVCSPWFTAPRTNDWSLPKAELEPGETWERALRGVEAETGLRCTLTSSLETATYT